MSEKNGNIVLPTNTDKQRIPDELMHEIQQIQGLCLIRGEKKPSVGKILMAAWERAYGKVNPISDDPGSFGLEKVLEEYRIATAKNVTSARAIADSSMATPSEYSLKPRHEDEPWVNKLLRVLTSDKPGLADAIKKNLTQFEDSAVYYECHGPADATAEAGGDSSESIGPARKDGDVAALEQVARDAKVELARDRKTLKGGTIGARRHPKKTGSGGKD